jgi:alpha-tubulin suppressor-like RCC1 family protein
MLLTNVLQHTEAFYRLQARWRGHQARKQIETSSDAAIVLQSRARIMLANAALAERRSATARLNRLARGALGRFRSTAMLVVREQRRVRAVREKEMLLLSHINSVTMTNRHSRVVDVDVINDHSDTYQDGWAAPVERLSETLRTSKPPQSLTGFAVSASHCSLLSSAGEVYSFGEGSQGQLGLGKARRVPQTKRVPLDGVIVKQLAAGEHHCVGLGDDGKIFSWGSNRHGALGLGDKVAMSCRLPRQVKGLRAPCCKVSCGSHHTAVLTEAGGVYTWGWSGQAATASPSSHFPQAMRSMKTRVTDISCGSDFTVAVSRVGNVFSWGRGRYGQLGHGNSDACGEMYDIWEPRVVVVVQKSQQAVASLGKSGGENRGEREGGAGRQDRGRGTTEGFIVDVACGGHHTLARSSTGAVYSWGSNSSGQLGRGEHLGGSSSSSCCGTPTRVLMRDGDSGDGEEHDQLDNSLKGGADDAVTVMQVAAGWRSSIVLATTGTIVSTTTTAVREAATAAIAATANTRRGPVLPVLSTNRPILRRRRQLFVWGRCGCLVAVDRRSGGSSGQCRVRATGDVTSFYPRPATASQDKRGCEPTDVRCVWSHSMSVTTVSFGHPVSDARSDGTSGSDSGGSDSVKGGACCTSRIRSMPKEQLREAAISLLLTGR